MGRALDLAQIAAHAVFGIRNECLACQFLEDIHRTDITAPTAVCAPFFPDLFNAHIITSIPGSFSFPEKLRETKKCSF
jgi:hypothetical protein